MNNTLFYKGYSTHIYYGVEDQLLFGKIENIKSLVCFHSDRATDIEFQFHLAVDDYLEMCKEHDIEPENPRTKFIKDWNDLVGLSSENYILDIDTKMGKGYILPKNNSTTMMRYYLSTHTFYGSHYDGTSKLLQKCGFNVKLNNWDNEE